MDNQLTPKMIEAVSLAECPIGLFWSGDELCMKTEYGNNEGRIDAFMVSSGEFFWGAPPQTITSQRASLVTPVDTDLAMSRLSQPEDTGVVEWLRSIVDSDWDEVVADGGVTAGMVIKQEAGEQLRRIYRAASAPITPPLDSEAVERVRANQDGSITLDNRSAQRLMDMNLLHRTEDGWFVGTWAAAMKEKRDAV